MPPLPDRMSPTAPSPPVPAPPGSLARAGFSDIDEQAAALVGWNQSYQQLSCGPFQGALQRLPLDGVGLFVEDLSQMVHQTGWVQPQVVAFGVPLLQQGEALFCGQVASESSLHVFSGEGGFQFRSPPRHAMLGIEIDRALFSTQVLESLPVHADHFSTRARLEACDAVALQRLRRFLLDLFASAAQHPGLWADEVPRAQARDELLERLACVLSGAGSGLPGVAGPGGPVAPRRPHAGPNTAQAALAERARQLVQARLDEPPTVAGLCHQLGVSRRTLQSSFQAVWGMGPLAWLNTLRLNAVRRRLKEGGSVTEAATQFGFWHFGHFASDYRALFGELPSQTLKRHRH